MTEFDNNNNNNNNNININNNNNNRKTWEGCSVLLDVNDGDRLVFARLTNGSTLKIGNKNFSLQPLIGFPFGSVFQVENGKEGSYLSRVLPTVEGDSGQENGKPQKEDECKDNRSIVDNNTAQTLTGEDIEAMKSQGATGDAIVQALISNSATFEKKTLFSQEKYLLKKQKKYAPKVLLRRPFTRSICEAYFKKYPNRIGYLRIDTLSLLLSMANVGAHSDVLVVDMVGGILTGAVAERLGGTGFVCNTYLGVKPYPTDIVKIFNFSGETCQKIVRCPLNELCSPQTGTCVHSGAVGISDVKSEPKEETTISSTDIGETAVSSDNGMLDIVPETSAAPLTKPVKAPKAGENASQEVIDSWKENGFSSLIVAAPDADAWGIVKELIPLLSYSAPFAIYHQYLQPLATCMHNLQVGKVAVGLQITEPWLREYQVLPSRTHPMMQMSGFGGYILTGTKICSTSDQPQLK